MISVSIGSHRFESGPTYHFNGSNLDNLIWDILDPTKTVEYVNALPHVNATPEEICQLAASGIVRLALQKSDFGVLERAGDTLVAVCGNGTVDRRGFIDRWSGEDVFYGSGLRNHTLDSASVLATRKTRVEETAGFITEEWPAEEGYFVIALANGGLISAARTYLHLGEGNHSFGAVKYSRHKSDDKEPDLYPYPVDRRIWLQRMAMGRRVVVIDEDYSTGETLRTATSYFANLFGAEVLGIAPIQIERRISFNPLVVKSDS